jgi:hypothetical protein
MSVPVGAERLKGGIRIVVFVAEDMVAKLDRMTIVGDIREILRCMMFAREE